MRRYASPSSRRRTAKSRRAAPRRSPCSSSQNTFRARPVRARPREEEPGVARSPLGRHGGGQPRMEDDGSPRAVVPRHLAGRNVGPAAGPGPSGPGHPHPKRALDLGMRDRPRPQKDRAPGIAQVDDRGFEPDPGRAPVQDVPDPRAQAAPDMLRGRRAHVSEEIRARRGEGHAGQPDQAPEQGMGGKADGHARQAGRRLVRHELGLRQDDRERARPELPRELQGGRVPSVIRQKRAYIYFREVA